MKNFIFRKFLFRSVCGLLAAAGLVGAAQAEGYTLLESITATGAQRILTDYIPSCTDRIEMKVNFTEASGTMALWSCRMGSSDRTMTMLWDSTNGYALRCDRNTSVGPLTSVKCQAGIDYVISADYGSLAVTINGASAATMGSGTFTPATYLDLFALHTGSATTSVSCYLKATVYYVRIWNASGALVHDYLPARDDSAADGATTQYGLFDAVDGKFLTTDQSSAFTPGAVVEDRRINEDLAVEYRTTFASSDNGSVTASVDGATVESPLWATEKQTVTLTPVPATGCQFVRWEGDAEDLVTASDGTVSFAGSARALTAVFAERSAEDYAKYTILDSITATGAQRVLAGFAPKCSDRIEMKFNLTEQNGTMALWCSRSGAASYSITMFYNAAGDGRLRCDRGGQTTYWSTAAYGPGVDYLISADYNALKVTMNGEYASDMGASQTASWSGGTELALFA